MMNLFTNINTFFDPRVSNLLYIGSLNKENANCLNNSCIHPKMAISTLFLNVVYSIYGPGIISITTSFIKEIKPILVMYFKILLNVLLLKHNNKKYSVNVCINQYSDSLSISPSNIFYSSIYAFFNKENGKNEIKNISILDLNNKEKLKVACRLILSFWANNIIRHLLHVIIDIQIIKSHKAKKLNWIKIIFMPNLTDIIFLAIQYTFIKLKKFFLEKIKSSKYHSQDHFRYGVKELFKRNKNFL